MEEPKDSTHQHQPEQTTHKHKKISHRFKSKSKSFKALIFIAIFAIIGGGIFLFTSFAAPAPPEQNIHDTGFHQIKGKHGEISQNVCSTQVDKGHARCLSYERVDEKAKKSKPKGKQTGEGNNANSNTDASGTTDTATPQATIGNNGGYDPSYLRSAYNLTAASATGGVGQTVAVTIAYDAPDIENDLNTYRANYGIPPCTTANGCFKKVDQRGGTNFPSPNSGWYREGAMDVQLISAICPKCHITFVEADDNSDANLGIAVNQAVAQGANVVSNSWGGSQSPDDGTSSSTYYNHPGIAIVFASGDNGSVPIAPATSPYVTSAGGTSLYQNNNTGSRDAAESAWSRGGSGCSSYEYKPAWQPKTICGSYRATADVSAVADPATGVWVYNSIFGWWVWGGTSASAPIIAGVYALNNNPSSTTQLAAAPYGNTAAFNDITTGCNFINGVDSSCGCEFTNGYCTAIPGYDNPTGWGTPNGIAGFSLASALKAPGSGGGVTPPPPPPTDTQAPNAATNLVASVTDATNATLTWAPATDNVGIDHYAVYLSSSRTPITTSANFISPTPLKANTSYSYYVVAYDLAGNHSANSAKFSFKTPSVTSGKASVTGLLLDSSTGKPIAGKVCYKLASSTAACKATNVSATSTYTITNLTVGANLAPVDYSFTFSATGYISQTITKTITANQNTIVEGSLGR